MGRQNIFLQPMLYIVHKLSLCICTKFLCNNRCVYLDCKTHPSHYNNVLGKDNYTHTRLFCNSYHCNTASKDEQVHFHLQNMNHGGNSHLVVQVMKLFLCTNLYHALTIQTVAKLLADKSSIFTVSSIGSYSPPYTI